MWVKKCYFFFKKLNIVTLSDYTRGWLKRNCQQIWLNDLLFKELGGKVQIYIHAVYRLYRRPFGKNNKMRRSNAEICYCYSSYLEKCKTKKGKAHKNRFQLCSFETQRHFNYPFWIHCRNSLRTSIKERLAVYKNNPLISSESRCLYRSKIKWFIMEDPRLGISIRLLDSIVTIRLTYVDQIKCHDMGLDTRKFCYGIKLTISG